MAESLCDLLLGYWAGLHGGPKAQTPNVEDAFFALYLPILLCCPVKGMGADCSALLDRLLETNFLCPWKVLIFSPSGPKKINVFCAP